MPNFLDLGIKQELNKTLKSNGFVKPTPIQEKTIPNLLAGNDVIAQAQTGTGKTLAFILPILEKVNPNHKYIQALIVTPTRELALQITSEFKKMVADLEGVNVLAAYGGQDVEKQLKKLKGANHVVIGTPGRLLDHLRRGTIELSGVSMLVLDEADQMLHMGFLADVEQIIQNLPYKRQTMLFSATMPSQIRSLATHYMRKPVDIRISGNNQVTLKEIKQVVIETTDRAKQANLFSLIDQYRPFLAIIFCRTKRRANKLNEALQVHGYDSDELHGDLSQSKREQVMKRFREVKMQLLVATDVAARGLDVEGITHIFNYDIPQDVESYIHRIGRTGRAGQKGTAITFVTPKDRSYLEMIEKGISLSIKKQASTITQANETFEDEGTQSKEKKSDKRGRNKNVSKNVKNKKRPDKNSEKSRFSNSNSRRNSSSSSKRSDSNNNKSSKRSGTNNNSSSRRSESNNNSSSSKRSGTNNYSSSKRTGSSQKGRRSR